MPRPNNRPSRSNQPSESKPYSEVKFRRNESGKPDPNKPKLYKPEKQGHHLYRDSLFHGSISLELRVETALHVSTGVVAMGKDVGSSQPLVKTMQISQDKLTIPGSSLKGALRSIFEAITKSNLGVVGKENKNEKWLGKISTNIKASSQAENLCIASLLFGAMSWQGLVHCRDAVGTSNKLQVGFMPSLHRPRPDKRVAYFCDGVAVGRKFYYHAVKAVSGGGRGLHVQQVGKNYTFKTQIQFSNLSDAQLGALLISLGQDPDPNHSFAIKLGAGKPLGFGTVSVSVVGLVCDSDLNSRYQSYHNQSLQLEGQALQERMQTVMKAAHRTQLVDKAALESIARILKWPTTRVAQVEY